MCSGGGVSSSFKALQGYSNAVTADAVSKGNAKTVRSVANLQASKIKEGGRKNASSARAAAAENGLDVDVGSAALIEDEHLADAEYNAEMTKRGAGYQAERIRREGKMQRNNYGMEATSDLFNAVGQLSGGWK